MLPKDFTVYYVSICTHKTSSLNDKCHFDIKSITLLLELSK